MIEKEIMYLYVDEVFLFFGASWHHTFLPWSLFSWVSILEKAYVQMLCPRRTPFQLRQGTVAKYFSKLCWRRFSTMSSGTTCQSLRQVMPVADSSTLSQMFGLSATKDLHWERTHKAEQRKERSSLQVLEMRMLSYSAKQLRGNASFEPLKSKHPLKIFHSPNNNCKSHSETCQPESNTFLLAKM